MAVYVLIMGLLGILCFSVSHWTLLFIMIYSIDLLINIYNDIINVLHYISNSILHYFLLDAYLDEYGIGDKGVDEEDEDDEDDDDDDEEDDDDDDDDGVVDVDELAIGLAIITGA